MSFKNVLIIVTSNIGSRTIASQGGNLTSGVFMGRGGSGISEADSVRHSRSRLRSLVLEEVKSHFKPELLNR